MQIGDRIRARREELGLSLEDVAKKLLVNRSTVKRYESGETRRISLPTIEKLAAVLDTTVEYLMGWDQKKPEDDDFAAMARLMRKLPKEKKEVLLKVARAMSDIADDKLKE